MRCSTFWCLSISGYIDISLRCAQTIASLRERRVSALSVGRTGPSTTPRKLPAIGSAPEVRTKGWGRKSSVVQVNDNDFAEFISICPTGLLASIQILIFTSLPFSPVDISINPLCRSRVSLNCAPVANGFGVREMRSLPSLSSLVPSLHESDLPIYSIRSPFFSTHTLDVMSPFPMGIDSIEPEVDGESQITLYADNFLDMSFGKTSPVHASEGKMAIDMTKSLVIYVMLL